MEVLHFSDFQQEIISVGLKNPKTTIDFNSVKLAPLPFFNDILGQFFLWGGSCIVFLDPVFLFASLLIFCVSLYFLYFHFIGMNVCRIDFTEKKITIKNRIFIFNWIRNLWGMNQSINFNDIKEIRYQEGKLLDRFRYASPTRYLLTIETFLNPSITASQFKKEEEAQKIVTIFKKFILNKEKIIT